MVFPWFSHGFPYVSSSWKVYLAHLENSSARYYRGAWIRPTTVPRSEKKAFQKDQLYVIDYTIG